MCNLYSMTATVDELRRMFGPFEGETSNVPSFGEIYPSKPAPVLRRTDNGAGLKLDMMEWGFPGPAAAKGRPVPYWAGTLNGTVLGHDAIATDVTMAARWIADGISLA